jgi:hypothetical protein
VDPETATEMGQRLREWRQAHPQATCDEIEDEVQRQWAPVQAQMGAELAQHGAGGTLPKDARPQCPDCQRPMQARGRRRRRVATRQGEAITLERTYYVCPLCGAGVFPPG